MQKDLIAILDAKLKSSSQRFMLGICGAPGSGKSTFAQWIIHEIRTLHPGAVVLVPMDGYHMSNEELLTRGLVPLKGIPETFDSGAFLKKLAAIRNDPTTEHSSLSFYRNIDSSVEDISVRPEHKLVVVEGNYLLLDSAPWVEIRNVLDEIWFIETDEKLRAERLLARHMEGGKSAAAAIEKINSTDQPNAQLIEQGKKNATRVIATQEYEFPTDLLAHLVAKQQMVFE